MIPMTNSQRMNIHCRFKKMPLSGHKGYFAFKIVNHFVKATIPLFQCVRARAVVHQRRSSPFLEKYREQTGSVLKVCQFRK